MTCIIRCFRCSWGLTIGGQPAALEEAEKHLAECVGPLVSLEFDGEVGQRANHLAYIALPGASLKLKEVSL